MGHLALIVTSYWTPGPGDISWWVQYRGELDNAVIRLKLLVTCKQWLLFGVGLGLLLFWDPAQAIELDLESERLETMIEERAARHKIMLGRLKKISNNLDPKSEQLVQGIRHYETFRAASGELQCVR